MPDRLSDLTTLRLGGPMARPVTVTSAEEAVEALRASDAAGAELLLVGGGSNLVAADAGWPGTTLLMRSAGYQARPDGDTVDVTAAAGEPWDDLVAQTVEQGWSGLETMSGIPGLVGATPVQNVGAYGAEIADVIAGLRVYDRQTGRDEQWAPERCGFGFRTSAFKHTDRYVVLEVTFRLTARPVSVPLRYLELARCVGVEPGASAPLGVVRETVLSLRRGKGMLLDAADHDTWSVGSFFVNPLLDVVPDAARDCPHWSADGSTKLSAAWLIENAGFAKGYRRGRVSVSTKHSLALTNRGGATTAELLELAAEIRDGVQARFGIRLRPEARLAPNVPAFT